MSRGVLANVLLAKVILAIFRLAVIIPCSQKNSLACEVYMLVNYLVLELEFMHINVLPLINFALLFFLSLFEIRFEKSFISFSF